MKMTKQLFPSRHFSMTSDAIKAVAANALYEIIFYWALIFMDFIGQLNNEF